MPVTAKLSRKFYEKSGDDVANELVPFQPTSWDAPQTLIWTVGTALVEWFNMVDAAYRLDLKELNELNFARFDAKLEQRIAELRAEMQAGFAQLETRLTRRLLGFWVAQAATTAALVLGVVKLTH